MKDNGSTYSNTSRTRVEQALLVSETRYRRLFETAKDGILIIDAETGMIKDVNPFLVELLGYSKKQFIEKYIWDIGVFKDIVANQKKFLELQQNEYIRYDNLPLQASDGRRISVEFVSNVYLVDEQRVIQCNIRDITERVHAEEQAREALHVSEARYRRLFETAKDGILILDAKTGMIKDVNPFLVDMLGYSKIEFIEKYIWDLSAFKDIVANKNNFLELQKNEYIRYDNLPLQASNGRLISVEFVSNVYLVDKQRVIQCNIRDITARKKLEMALTRDKQLLDTILTSIVDGVISCDSKGNVVFINQAAESLTGWSRETASGEKVEKVLNIVDELTRKKDRNFVKKALERRTASEFSNHITLITKDGIERSIEYSSAPIVPKDDDNSGLAFVFRDCSEKRLKREEIEFISYHDHLTGLYNRRYYEEELERLDTERNLPLTLVMGDVNGLKLINDSFGHSMGDQLLKKMADVIKEACRADDIMARLGGDEFIIILPKTDSFEAEQIIKRITSRLSKKELDLSIYPLHLDLKQSIIRTRICKKYSRIQKIICIGTSLLKA